MRTTRASAAIDRLKRRSGNQNYSMTLSANGLFCLTLADDMGKSSRLCAPMQLDDFVAFVNAHLPPAPKRESKLDVAFQKQLGK